MQLNQRTRRLVLVSVAAFVASISVATAEARTLVACDNGGQLVRLAHPKRCNFPTTALPGRRALMDAGHIYVEKLRHWRHWGRKTTRARGTFIGNMDYRASVTVKLSGRRKCRAKDGGSFYVYTRGRFSGFLGPSYLGGC